MALRRLRVFISSPGDVGQERVLAGRVIERLAGEFSAVATLEPVLWEHEPMRATSHFQEQIVRPSETDFVVCILWSRLGTRLPSDQFTRPDGTSYGSGTEFEFEDAAESVRARGIPDLLVYRRTSEPHVSLRDEAELERRRAQLKMLDAFVERWFQNPEGTLRAGFKTYERADEFEAQLERDLRKLIVERLEREGIVGVEETTRATWLSGSPFRGLLTFDPEHEEIFFGRTRAIAEVKEALAERAGRGTAFLLVLGMSGSGKSSLVRAGLIPTVTRPGVVEGVGLWRWCIVRPGEEKEGGELLASLVKGLCEGESALPELASGDFGTAELVGLLARSPEDVVPPIKAALRRRAEAVAEAEKLPQAPEARLLLLIDQTEELFTHARIGPGERSAYVRALGALARSGLVWVVGTMRSDFYHRLAEEPDLAELVKGDGQFLLLPPTDTELAQIIRGPARAAGLRFEEERGQSLEDVLQGAAAGNAEALPLLEFVLEQLYERCGERRQLTFAAYQEIGGLEGALSRHAEKTFAGLSEEAKAELPAILRALVTVDEEGKQASARAPRAQVATSAARGELIDAFVKARLLVADRKETGEPVLRLAHEALIEHWARLKEWLAEDREFLRTRARVASAGARWEEEGRAKDFLLPEGRPLAEAEELLQRRRAELDPNAVEYVQASVAAHRVRLEAERVRAKRRLRQAWAVAGVLLALVAVAAAAMLRARDREQQAKSALANSYAATARQLFADQQADRGLPFLAKAASNDTSNRALGSLLLEALLHERWSIPQGKPMKHDDAVSAVAFSPDSERVVTASSDKTARIWDARSGAPIGQPMKHDNAVSAVAFSPEGERVVTASSDKTARIWDARSGAPIGQPMKHDDEVWAVAFSPDGERVVTASEDETARIWDARSGAPIGQPMKHDNAVWAVAFSPDGERVVTASEDETARIWDARSGAPIGQPMKHDNAVSAVAFSPEGERVVTASSDKTARIWDARSGAPIGQPMKHDNAVWAVAFSPDGERVVTASEDETARIWDARSGAPIGQPMKHDSAIWAVAFSPDGERVVTASEDETARIWDARSGAPIGQPMKPGGPVAAAAFSPNGERVVTASSDKTARIWDARSGAPIGQPMKQDNAIGAVAFSPDGERVVIASEDKTARIWDARSGAPIGQPMKLWAVAFSPNGERVITASDDKIARIWDARSGPIWRPMKHNYAVVAVAVSPDGERVVTASDNIAYIWDTRSGFWIAELKHDDFVVAVAVSPDGERVVTASWDKTARIWDARSGDPIGQVMKHDDKVSAVAFSPDSERVVTASEDKTARIWDAGSGAPIGQPMKHDDAVSAVAFSPDSERVVTASEDKTARIWDAGSGAPIGQPMKHGGAVRAVAVSPDGERVVTASEDKTARIWDARSGAPIGQPMKHDDAVFGVAFSPDGERVVTASEDKTARIWSSPVGSTDDEKLIASLAEALAGVAVSDSGALVPVPDRFERVEAIRASLAKSTTSDTSGQAVVRWLLSDPWTRTISPASTTTVPDYIKSRLAEGTPEARSEVEREFPDHPLLRGAPH